MLNKLTINQLENYIIDCIGYSVDELKEDIDETNTLKDYKDSLIETIEATQGNDEACINYNK